ncbi:MAG: hypothetical protein DRJ09_00720 [Bacteroidetes bacterium]|nr:MAG: hypothetical protein DRJ09_00720 [Bacteroidota bacterium]
MKKIYSLTLVLLLIGSVLKGQNSSPVFFDEFSMLLSKANLNYGIEKEGPGFGFGVYKNIFSKKIVNLVPGFEFNRSVQYIEQMSSGHYGKYTDLTIYISTLSFPVYARVNFGHKVKFFLEAGAFVDFTLGSQRKGMSHFYKPGVGEPPDEGFPFEEKLNLEGINYGMSMGLGISIPVSKINLIIKPDYKFGVRALYSYQDSVFNRYFRLAVAIKLF